MEISEWWACLVVYFLGSVAKASAAGDADAPSTPSLSASDCSSLGYNSADLLCSSCDALVQFSLGHHSDECKKCCKGDGGGGLEGQEKYPKAILEVCG